MSIIDDFQKRVNTIIAGEQRLIPKDQYHERIKCINTKCNELMLLIIEIDQIESEDHKIKSCELLAEGLRTLGDEMTLLNRDMDSDAGFMVIPSNRIYLVMVSQLQNKIDSGIAKVNVEKQKAEKEVPNREYLNRTVAVRTALTALQKHRDLMERRANNNEVGCKRAYEKLHSICKEVEDSLQSKTDPATFKKNVVNMVEESDFIEAISQPRGGNCIIRLLSQLAKAIDKMIDNFMGHSQEDTGRRLGLFGFRTTSERKVEEMKNAVQRLEESSTSDNPAPSHCKLRNCLRFDGIELDQMLKS